MTIQQKLKAALEAEGEKEVMPNASGKYLKMSRKEGGFYWLGFSGALRFGQTSSGSVPSSRKATLLAKRGT